MNTSAWFRVDGMVAVVTGGGTGIGLMLAKALVGGGAGKVYILGRRTEILDAAVAEHPGFLVPILCDVTSKESLQSAVDVVKKDTGHVNLVVANAGALGPTKRLDDTLSIEELRKSMFEDVSMEHFTETLDVNVTGAYFTMLAFLELLDAGNKKALQGGFGAPSLQDGDDANVPAIQSQVIFMSSVGGYSRDGLSPPAYSASKSALTHLAKHASSNLSKYEIRVNVLAPGLFPSLLASGMTVGRDPAAEIHGDRMYIPARKFGGMKEMGGTILYLASQAGSYCNGLVLLLDGGRLSVMLSEY
ncbi:Short-chain dehydrogenase/reductase sat3 [Conoideocrella luteorostrata]|uniref:Short-chain dehydrogenase/reductase sat3 n=1 Tax=Conoideocrella luteorostrata TaxID=1105319 RepID=A0AAJ0CGI3_9HYPO|nr:Short-chain dehydrogenase/reductase sat3 [Conoideocrella luteorostrata]